MTKIIAYPVKLFLFLITSSNCFSQTETFDIATYTAPKDWKKDAKNGVVNYTYINEAAGSFCVITIYASSASSGDAQKDFNNEWAALVVTPYKTEANTETEIQTTEDGWKVVTGAALVKLDNNDVYIILNVLSGFGKTMSIRSSLNDQSYTAQIDALFETMELDKTKTASANNNNTVPMQTNSSTGKFGLMTYTAPAGWTEQKFGDGVVFKPSDIPAGEHLAMQIMTPLNFAGTLEQALAQSFAEATTMYSATSMYQSDGKYRKNAPKKSFNGWEYLSGKGGIKVNDGTQFGTEYGLELFVVKINNRFERVAILESRPSCKPYYSRYYTSDRISYRNSIEHFLFTLEFTDFNATILQSGSAKGSGVIGVWQGIIQSTSAATMKLEVYDLVLLNNGQVYFGSHFPSEGLDGLNTRIPSELSRRDWKTYNYSNGNGILNMIFADIPFRTQGDKIIVTKNQTDWSFVKMPSVDGATFNGTYKMGAVQGKIPSISFTSNGKFTDNGAVKVLCHEYIDCLNPALTPGSGTYEVKDYTIHFNYTDGRKIKIAFLGAEYDRSNPSPPTLRMSYNEDPMTRQ
ncbi:MAG: hypothetical protein ACXWV8_13800 [Chitinophagaceae bacterium]